MKSTRKTLSALGFAAASLMATISFAGSQVGNLGVLTPTNTEAYALRPLGATVQLLDTETGSGVHKRVVVKGVFQASNTCQAPLETELVVIRDGYEGSVDLTVGQGGEPRRCPRIFAPVRYEVVVLDQVMDNAFASGTSFTVNGEKAVVLKSL